MDLHGYQALTWTLASLTIAAFTIYAMSITYLRRQRLRGSLKFNQEEFITARSQVGALRIGWSFFAGALGAWVLATPAAYTGGGYGYGTGAIGLVFYSLASGTPILMIAFAGNVIRRKVPHVLSLTDYMGWRFGWAAKTYIVLLCLFNMTVAILAEYLTMGALFKVYLGSVGYPITIAVGLFTMLYTTYGGLFVSIMTDQIQGVAVTLLFTLTVIYTAATFRYDLPTPFPNDCCDVATTCTPEANPNGFCLSGTNEAGYSSIFVMPASLFTATVFSEAMWQRAWASADRKSLVKGSILGCIGIVLVVFFVAFCGILAAWAGLLKDNIMALPEGYNLYFFAALGAIDSNTLTINKWIGVPVILLGVCMNMSAVDSLQNGLGAAISSHMLKGRPVSWTKIAVLLINVPMIVLGGVQPGSMNTTVLQLFLVANMLCCTSALPVLSGLFESLHPFLGGGSVIFAGLFSIFCTSWYGVDYYYRKFASISANDFSGKYQSKTFSAAMNFTWMGNGYKWDFFLVPICVSLGCLILCAVLNWASQRCMRKPALLGFTAPATHPDMYPSTAGVAFEADSDEGKESGSQEFVAKPEEQAVA